MKANPSNFKLRFAPSPTGELHLGGARTAIFNWLFAQKMNGEFLLRIEDTDKKRSKKVYTEQILSSLRWLGIIPTNKPVYQSNQINRHHKIVNKLLSRDKAYPCYCTPEELNLERETTKKLRLASYHYSGKCKSLTKEEIRRKKEDDSLYCIRLKIPDGVTVWDDGVYGKIKINNDQIDDFIILRKDSSPTYMLAVVVDDLDMEITHIIRGEDHLTNTAKQILIYQALMSNIPNFTHLPLILGSDKKKLSKRHNAPSLTDFQMKGLHPEAVLLYLGQLGWTAPNDEEILDLNRLIEVFDVEHISKKGAVWDEKKITWFAGKHLKELPVDDVISWLSKYSSYYNKPNSNYLRDIVRLIKDRAKTSYEVINFAQYFFEDPIKFDESALKKRWKINSLSILSEFQAILDVIEDNFTASNLEYQLRDFAKTKGISIGEVIHPIRIAITGEGVSPGIFEILEIMGKEKVCKRLKTSLEKLSKL